MKTNHNQSPRSLSQLQAEIQQVSARINEREVELIAKAKKLPRELVLATGEAILPLILGNELAKGAEKLIRTGVDWMRGKKQSTNESPSYSQQAADSAKQLGIASLIKFLFNIWKRK
jgi:hypothetical protein